MPWFSIASDHRFTQYSRAFNSLNTKPTQGPSSLTQIQLIITHYAKRLSYEKPHTSPVFTCNSPEHSQHATFHKSAPDSQLLFRMPADQLVVILGESVCIVPVRATAQDMGLLPAAALQSHLSQLKFWPEQQVCVRHPLSCVSCRCTVGRRYVMNRGYS